MPDNLGGLMDAAADLGLVRGDTQYCAEGVDQLVTCGDPAVKVSSWRLPDRVLLVVRYPQGDKPKDVSVKLDMAKLGVVPVLKWQDFVGVRDLGEEPGPTESKLDFYAGELKLKAMRPNTARLVGIRKY
jgi:hypothetical protein